MDKKLPKKVLDAIHEVDAALDDAILNRDGTVIINTKAVQTVVDFAKGVAVAYFSKED